MRPSALRSVCSNREFPKPCGTHISFLLVHLRVSVATPPSSITHKSIIDKRIVMAEAMFLVNRRSKETFIVHGLNDEITQMPRSLCH